MSHYRIYVLARAWAEIKSLPGHMRQRVKREVGALADNPRPAHSTPMTVPEEVEGEVRRLRLDRWRVVYAISENERVIDVLPVRKRPPYDYGDVARLLEEASAG